MLQVLQGGKPGSCITLTFTGQGLNPSYPNNKYYRIMNSNYYVIMRPDGGHHYSEKTAENKFRAYHQTQEEDVLVSAAIRGMALNSVASNYQDPDTQIVIHLQNLPGTGARYTFFRGSEEISAQLKEDYKKKMIRELEPSQSGAPSARPTSCSVQ